jgi:hypothetical protein
VKLKFPATAEIVSTAVAVAAIWIAIDRGMNVPLTQAVLKLLAGTFKKRQKNVRVAQLQPQLEILESRSTDVGWWREKNPKVKSTQSSEDSESGSEGIAQDSKSKVHDLPSLLGKFRRRKPVEDEGKRTV